MCRPSDTPLVEHVTIEGLYTGIVPSIRALIGEMIVTIVQPTLVFAPELEYNFSAGILSSRTEPFCAFCFLIIRDS